MARVDDHCDAVGAECFVDGIRDLRGQFFLDLQALAEDVDDAHKFRQSHHAAVWDVCDMRFAHERHHVMLAVAVNLDVLEEDEFVVAFDFREGSLQWLVGISAVSPEVFVHRFDDSRWRVDQPLAVGIFADETQEGTDIIHRLLCVRSVEIRFLHGAEIVAGVPRDRHCVSVEKSRILQQWQARGVNRPTDTAPLTRHIERDGLDGMMVMVRMLRAGISEFRFSISRLRSQNLRDLLRASSDTRATLVCE